MLLEVQYVAVEKLVPFGLVRGVDKVHVKKLFDICKAGLWNIDSTMFSVVDSKAEKGKYLLLDGNHRFTAFAQMNQENSVDNKPPFVKVVKCSIYRHLSLAQQLHVANSPSPEQTQLPVFLVDKVRMIRNYCEKCKLSEGNVGSIAKAIFNVMFTDAPFYVGDLAALPEHHWNVVRNLLTEFNSGKIKVIFTCLLLETRIFYRKGRHRRNPVWLPLIPSTSKLVIIWISSLVSFGKHSAKLT